MFAVHRKQKVTFRADNGNICQESINLQKIPRTSTTTTVCRSSTTTVCIRHNTKSYTAVVEETPSQVSKREHFEGYIVLLRIAIDNKTMLEPGGGGSLGLPFPVHQS